MPFKFGSGGAGKKMKDTERAYYQRSERGEKGKRIGKAARKAGVKSAKFSGYKLFRSK